MSLFYWSLHSPNHHAVLSISWTSTVYEKLQHSCHISKARDVYAPKCGRIYKDNHIIEISTLCLGKISGIELLKPDRWKGPEWVVIHTKNEMTNKAILYQYQFPHVYISLLGLRMYYKLGDLPTEVYCLTLSEPTNPKSSVGSFWELYGKIYSVSLPASDGLLATFGLPWLVEASPQSLLSSPHGVLPVCVYFWVQISLFYDTSYIGLGPSLMTLF